ERYSAFKRLVQILIQKMLQQLFYFSHRSHLFFLFIGSLFPILFLFFIFYFIISFFFLLLLFFFFSTFYDNRTCIYRLYLVFHLFLRLKASLSHILFGIPIFHCKITFCFYLLLPLYIRSAQDNRNSFYSRRL